MRTWRREGGAGDRGASSAQGRRLDCRFGGGHGEERTSNIWPMFVTLDVSKLSGWLNADASCRVERRVYDAERGVCAGGGRACRRQRTSGMHGEEARL